MSSMKKRILIIDDETKLVDLVKEWLESKDYKVSAAYNGLNGLEKAKNEKPDLVILDINMPGLDGFEVLSSLRKNQETKYTPVIMLTVKRETESIMKAQDLETTDYIMKPFSVKRLLNLVRKYVL